MAANYAQPDAMNKRARFYDGQFLQDQDFIDEQKYHLDRQRRLTRLLHVAGIANGLDVRTTNQPFQVRVMSGTAVDPDGRLVVLDATKTILDNDGRPLLANAAEPVALPADAASSTHWLYIAYHQMPDDLQASGDGVEGETRWHEAPYLFTAVAPLGEDDTYDGPPWHDFLTDGPAAPVLLARLMLDANGAVTIDGAGRRYSGLRLPGLRGGNQAVGLRAEGDGRVGLWLLKDGDLVEHLSVTEKGFVGVGSPAPSAALEIRTELKATVQNRTLVGLRISPNYNANNISGVKEYGLLVEQGSVGIGVTEPIQTLDVNGRIHVNNGVIQRGGTAVTNTSDLGLYSQVPGNWIRFVTNNAPIRFYTDSGAGTTHKLTIEANGNVGIGTIAPTATLDVNGTLQVVSGGSGTWNKLVVTPTSEWGDANATYVTIGAGGAAGIMLSNPHVTWRDSRASIRYGRSGGIGSGYYWDVGVRTNNAFSFSLNGVSDHKLWLGANGNIGIGTTTPTAKLEVLADTTTAGGWYEALRFGRAEHSAITHPGGGLLFGLHGNRNFYFGDIQGGTFQKYMMTINADSGNVGIGTDSPSMKLTVSGSANHLQLRRESSETTGDKQLFLELFQNDTSPPRVPETYQSIRFHHGNRYWHRIEARTNGIHFKDGYIGGDGYISVFTGTLTVNAGLYAGNSDMYFTKTDHNHSAIGNTAGYAAIENASSHDALMILGRAGTSKGRSVKLWDFLQVNGDLEVTGEIRGKVWYSGEYSWSQGQGAVRMGHSNKCVAFLTFVQGKFEGAGEYVQIYVGGDGYWYLGGASQQASVSARARCIGTS